MPPLANGKKVRGRARCAGRVESSSPRCAPTRRRRANPSARCGDESPVPASALRARSGRIIDDDLIGPGEMRAALLDRRRGEGAVYILIEDGVLVRAVVGSAA